MENIIKDVKQTATVEPVASYTKFERLFGWLQSLLLTVMLYTMVIGFVRGKSAPNMNWFAYVILGVDLIIVWGYYKTLTDVGVNPHTTILYTYGMMFVRLLLNYFLFVKKPANAGHFTGSRVTSMSVICFVLGLVALFMAIKLRMMRKNKGMFVEQSEAAFSRDRKHNIAIVKILNVIMILYTVFLLIYGSYKDITSNEFIHYGAVKFVTILKIFFWLMTLYGLVKNLRFVLDDKFNSRISGGKYVLFMVLMLLDLLLRSTFYLTIPGMVVYTLLTLTPCVAVFYVND